MKRFTIIALAITCLSVGCQNNKQDDEMAASGSVLDVTAPTAPAAQPVVYEAPLAVAPVASMASGSSYTVQKGDTLWKIASTTYGNGNQWQRIAAANPGVTPESLKAGQTITIP